MPELLTSEQAAEMLQVSLRTLEAWRRDGSGPPHLRLGNKTIRYFTEDLCLWLNSRRENPINSEVPHGSQDPVRQVALPLRSARGGARRVNQSRKFGRHRLVSDSRMVAGGAEKLGTRDERGSRGAEGGDGGPDERTADRDYRVQ